MYYGEHTFGWNEKLYHHLERNDIMERISNIKYKDGDRGDDYDYIRKVLESYKHKSHFYGMKMTNFSTWSWAILKPIFEEIWGDELICCTIIRDPFRNYDDNKTMENRYKSMKFQRYLLKSYRFKCLLFPDYWDDGRIIQFVNKLGMEWNDEIYLKEKPEMNPTLSVFTKGYAPDKPSRSLIDEGLESKYPKTLDLYNEMLGYLQE